MAKKIVALAIAFLMLFSLVACQEENVGMFYTLQDAYDQGLLTVEDLENIAYYLNGGSDDDTFVPKAKTPSVLTDATEKAIKQTRVYELRTWSGNRKPKATIEDITIIGYYGTYNDCVSVRLNDIYTEYPAVVREIVVAGVTFIFSGASVVIWK